MTLIRHLRNTNDMGHVRLEEAHQSVVIVSLHPAGTEERHQDVLRRCLNEPEEEGFSKEVQSKDC